MAFGQQSGPPATAKQVNELLDLLQQVGHDDFRDARGPMGFTQRQANGKFTRDEADQLIEQLQAEVDAGSESGAAEPAPRTPAPRVTAAERTVRGLSSEILAAELQRRGWVVLEP